MPTSKTVKRVPGAGKKSGPMFVQRLASTRMVPNVTKQSMIHPGGGSMEGWRQSRMRPQGGPSQSEYRRVKR